MQVRNTAGGVILGQDGRVVVVNQDGLTWSLPKGKLDEGEDELTAAKREIKEETGLTNIKLIRKLGTYERHPMDREAKDIPDQLRQVTMFLFTTDETELKPEDPANPEARWVEIDKVADLLTHKKDKEFFLSCCSDFKSILKSPKPIA